MEVGSRLVVAAEEEGEGRTAPVCQAQRLYLASLLFYFGFVLVIEPRVSCLVDQHCSTELELYSH